VSGLQQGRQHRPGGFVGPDVDLRGAGAGGTQHLQSAVIDEQLPGILWAVGAIYGVMQCNEDESQYNRYSLNNDPLLPAPPRPAPPLGRPPDPHLLVSRPPQPELPERKRERPLPGESSGMLRGLPELPDPDEPV
jgi:hypothetical protein